jgi:tetratricopeptide (TPR) repeat protein
MRLLVKARYYIFGAVVTAIAVSAFFLFLLPKFSWMLYPMDYVIPDIPYFGHYSSDPGPFVTSAGAVLGILDAYWWNANLESLEKVNQQFSDMTYRYDLEYLSRYINKRFGAPMARTVNIKNVKEMRRFLNPEQRTPLVIAQKLVSDQGYEGKTTFFRLVIGVIDSQRKVIVHDYYFGDSYEISYQDFEKMWDGVPDAWRVLVARPDDFQSALAQLEGKRIYPALNAGSRKAIELTRGPKREMLKNFELALEHLYANRHSQAIAVLQKIIDDPNAHLMSTNGKRFVYLDLAISHYLLKDYASAEAAAIEAVELNKQLAAEKEDLGDIGFPRAADIIIIPDPWIWLGAIYEARGKNDLARKAYQDALLVDPLDERARRRLERLI